MPIVKNGDSNLSLNVKGNGINWDIPKNEERFLDNGTYTFTLQHVKTEHTFRDKGQDDVVTVSFARPNLSIWPPN